MKELNLGSLRARKARLGRVFNSVVFNILIVLGLLSFGIAALSHYLGYSPRVSFALLAVFILAVIVCAWYQMDLKSNPIKAGSVKLEDLLETRLLGSLKRNTAVDPFALWDTSLWQWQGRFIADHLLLNTEEVQELIKSDNLNVSAVWEKARDLTETRQTHIIDGATIVVAILLVSPALLKYLTSINLSESDVLEVLDWQVRLNKYLEDQKPYFGGIGRDWAAGFTPTLDSFGDNISKSIEAGRAGHYHTLSHSDVLDSIIHNLVQGKGGLALVGDTGTGKTSLVYALAQRLLEGRDESLKYYQIINLSASEILSSQKNNIERIVLTLLAEAVRAGNIIIFLDDARLFFGSGAGALDLGQILMPLLQGGPVKIITTFTPNDFQHLKSTNESLASALAVINISEPDPSTVLKILEDTALTIEQQSSNLVSYQATREAYRLSGQYSQDQSYPGKGIDLLQQAIPYASGGVMNAFSVQKALEITKGIKTSQADAPEADVLLHLEDNIHTRMINQERAVSAVASALRRGRAGVANPRRPLGSYLFLGPTGVGKTELARSLAATYFGSEHKMIRLDMSEYTQSSDVTRLLSTGDISAKSFINSVREQPFSVILLDEIEKAHTDVINLLLQMLDEGQLTDTSGKPVSFKNAIIITTSNAGSADIIARVGAGETLEGFEPILVAKLINDGLFRAELVNRFDEVVLFRPLSELELGQVATLMIGEVNKNLSKQNIQVKLTPGALSKVVQAGYDPKFGARPMRRAIENLVENPIADKILNGSAKAGDVITLDSSDINVQ
jgi:ATP-dependent Clp protease ATP-binding subunit ClpC